MSWVGRDFDGSKVVMARARCRHLRRRPQLCEPTERMRRSLVMLSVIERGEASVGDLAEWLGLGISTVYLCLNQARAFRREMKRRKRHADEVHDVA